MDRQSLGWLGIQIGAVGQGGGGVGGGGGEQMWELVWFGGWAVGLVIGLGVGGMGGACRHAAGLADPWLGRKLGGYSGRPLSRQLYGQLGR